MKMDGTFGECETYIQEALDSYFLELSKGWADSSNLVVRISQIESRLLDLDGILDIGNTTINGEAKNLMLDENSIPIRGEFHG